ncbi:hypothetical protein [Streptomyces sp. NPDC057382]|uniref:hypothetical protein n=1 Tax=unclassified Streptomyces TaxID=2593676 RepID=UPI00363224D0
MATTAQKLIAFREELQAARFRPDLIDELVKDASQTLVMNEGLHVPRSEQPAADASTQS